MGESVHRPSFVSSWDAMPALGLGGLAALYRWIFPALPDPVPTHFTIHGQADGWMPKEALFLPIFGLPVLIWLALSATAWALAKRQQDPARAKVASVQPLRGFLGLGMALLMMGGLLVPLRGLVILHAGMVALLALGAFGTVLTLREARKLLGDQPDAVHYRWGVIYVNPADPRLWVEKRLGVGWTLNYAHPAAGWVTGLLFLPVIVLLVLWLLK